MDEKGHKYRSKYKEIERQKALGKDLDCKFIRINPSEKDLAKYVEIVKIYIHINRSFKKSLTDKISKRLLKLEFKKNHLIKIKTLKYDFKNILPSL